MEEVDCIIIHFLRQLNIKIDEEVKNICELRVEDIIESASKCISCINPSLKLPAKLPPGVSHRIEVAAQIASACKDLGYKNDVGYQTFLYYNEAELRHVFMFLIEMLPSEGKQVVSTPAPTDRRSILMTEIRKKIEEELSSLWIPPCCNPTHQKGIGDFVDNAVQSRSLKIHLSEEEIIQKLQNMAQTKSQLSIPSEIKLVNEIEESGGIEESFKNERQEISKSLKELKETAILLRQKLDALESERNVMNVEYLQAQKSCDRAETELRNIDNILQSVGITNIAADTPESLLGSIQTNIAALHNRNEEITSKNISIKVEINKVRASLTSSESERSRCRAVLLELKEIAKGMRAEYETKEKLVDQLKAQYDRLRGGNKRSIYTKRIMEIISNVDKQNLEIKKILEDTRQLQKEINTLEGQLDRCFSQADETLFRDAKKDDQAKKAYKLLALLHSECNSIVSLVNDTGVMAREMVDLEDSINTERAKKTEDTLEKIRQDLDRMKQESVA